MIEKIRFGGEWSAKKWVAAILFGAIIMVFALWGIRPASMGDSAGGVAAVVNDRSISISEFRGVAENMEESQRQRFGNLPENQRRELTNMVRRQALEQLIQGEVIYQAAQKKGVLAPDGEIKEQILQIPLFQENGRFMGERYRAFLQSRNLTAEDFERQLRKQIVIQKVFTLFAGSALPARGEVERNRVLSSKKVNVRFVEISRDNLSQLGLLPATDIGDFSAKHKAEIEAYYKDNAIEFTDPDRFHARDILIRVDGKRSADEAKKLAEDIHKTLSAKNFAQVAAKVSEDPGTKAKGGDLGERQMGTLAPQFEMAVLTLKLGEISAPIQIEGGWHLILLESKTAGGKKTFEQVQNKIALKLADRLREPELLSKLRERVDKADRHDLEALVSRSGLKWQQTGEFDLAATAIPKLGNAREILPAVLKVGQKGGLVRQLIPHEGGFLVVDVTSFKTELEPKVDVEGMDRMLAYERAERTFSEWLKGLESHASIQRNPRIVQ